MTIQGRENGNVFKVLALLFSLLITFGFTACTSSPVVETVTTDAGRTSALPPGDPPYINNPNLPAPDPDIETAGDRIAEAITYLKTPRRDRREAALRALNRAETSINHALRSNSHGENVRNALHAALKDLDTAERAVQHNAPEAIKQLASINKNLDKISP